MYIWNEEYTVTTLHSKAVIEILSSFQILCLVVAVMIPHCRLSNTSKI